MEDLSSFELYNYYKLYKISVNEYTNDKLFSILKYGKNYNRIYGFKNFIYREKCRISLEKEYSNNSTLNSFNITFNNETFDKDSINLCFKSTDGQQFNLSVSKKIQFIVAVHKLYTKYPQLETRKIGTYICNGSRIKDIYDTIEENGLQEGNIILIINKFEEKNSS